MDKCISPDYEGGYEIREHNFDKKGWCVICGKHKLEDDPKAFGEFMAEEKLEDLMKSLRTPKDWNTIDPRDRASILVLSFIGYIARPKNIPKDILQKAVDAFNNNRGKTEIEIEAVDKVINEPIL